MSFACTITDKPRCYCGVFGIFNHPDAAKLTYLGLFSLQHRGQESCGIVTSDGNKLYPHKGEGLVADVFESSEVFSKLPGNMAIGHNRYSTTGANLPVNIAPFFVNLLDGPIALGHNGNLTNASILRHRLQKNGSIFLTSTDSEVFIHLIASSKETGIVNKIKDALKQVKGAYSLVILTRNKIIAARDPYGWRPLCMGKLGDSVVFASETCALDLIGGNSTRDIAPGEIVVISKDDYYSEIFQEAPRKAFCIFEYIYFSRPDSQIFGDYVDKTRRKLGKNLALEHPVEADRVIAVPDSSNTAALGYSQRSDTRFEIGLIRNHYIGRTFIQPEQDTRDANVRIKFNPVGGVLKDRSIVVVEDSIVRGTTLKFLIRLMKKTGIKEVHVRVSSPPIRFPCYFGMDFPTREELIANKRDVEGIRTFLGADSLGYLSLEKLLESVPGNPRDYCTACFSGEYPIDIEEDVSKDRYDTDFV